MSEQTSRCCRKCGAIFPVGDVERSALDTHCGYPTVPCPTFEGEWSERQKAYRDHFSGGSPIADPPRPADGRWWD